MIPVVFPLIAKDYIWIIKTITRGGRPNHAYFDTAPKRIQNRISTNALIYLYHWIRRFSLTDSVYWSNWKSSSRLRTHRSLREYTFQLE